MEVTNNIQQKIHSQRPRASHPNPSQSPFHRERRPTVQREDKKDFFFFFFKVFQRLKSFTLNSFNKKKKKKGGGENLRLALVLTAYL